MTVVVAAVPAQLLVLEAAQFESAMLLAISMHVVMG